MKKYSFNQSAKYRRFIQERDLALESIHQHTQLDIARLLNHALQRIEEIFVHRYTLIPQEHFFTRFAANTVQVLDNQIDALFHELGIEIFARLMRMRKSVYILSAAGETEAISRAKGQSHSLHLAPYDLHKVSTRKNAQGEDPYKRIVLALNRLKRDITDSIELSRVQELPLYDAKEKLIASFPSSKSYQKPKRVLKNRESKKKDDEDEITSLSTVFVSDDEWDAMVESYKNTELPSTRFYNEPFKDEDGDKIYAWEYEQDLTQDFVDQVRDGEHEGAKAAGVEDFLWIALVDQKTDECCLWRDGLTLTEIEDQLGGDHKDDECEAKVPPAHFNCRCKLAPVGEQDQDDGNDIKAGDFEQWLNS